MDVYGHRGPRREAKNRNSNNVKHLIQCPTIETPEREKQRE